MIFPNVNPCTIRPASFSPSVLPQNTCKIFCDKVHTVPKCPSSPSTLPLRIRRRSFRNRRLTPGVASCLRPRNEGEELSRDSIGPFASERQIDRDRLTACSILLKPPLRRGLEISWLRKSIRPFGATDSNRSLRLSNQSMPSLSFG